MVWAALQCFFYPLLVPVLRYQVRQERGIDVKRTFAFKIFIFNLIVLNFYELETINYLREAVWATLRLVIVVPAAQAYRYY
jgi:hypothetical protein